MAATNDDLKVNFLSAFTFVTNRLLGCTVSRKIAKRKFSGSSLF